MIFRNYYGNGKKPRKAKKDESVSIPAVVMNNGEIKPVSIKPIKLKNDKSKGNMKFIF